jgi:hypothetical protein
MIIDSGGLAPTPKRVVVNLLADRGSSADAGPT